MSLFRFLSPAHAYRDLRDYVAKREQPHRLLFLIISVGITSLLIAGFGLVGAMQRRRRATPPDVLCCQ